MKPKKLNVKHVYQTIGYKKSGEEYFHMHKGARIGKCYTCVFNTTCPYSNDKYNRWSDTVCMQYAPNDYGIYANVGIFSSSETYKLYYFFIRGAIYD